MFSTATDKHTGPVQTAAPVNKETTTQILATNTSISTVFSDVLPHHPLNEPCCRLILILTETVFRIGVNVSDR